MKRGAKVLICILSVCALLSIGFMLNGCGNYSEPASSPQSYSVDEFRQGFSPTEKPALIFTSIPTQSYSLNQGNINEDENIIVYVTTSGTKYHMDGCQYLSKSRIPITLARAKGKGYEPCRICNPPE